MVLVLLANVALSAPTDSNYTNITFIESSTKYESTTASEHLKEDEIYSKTWDSEHSEQNSSEFSDSASISDSLAQRSDTTLSYILLEGETSTVAGELVFANTPLEGLVNATTIASEDLNTLASFAFSSNTQSLVDSQPTNTRVEAEGVEDPQRTKNTCTHHGKEYFSGESLEQADPCNFCVCVNGYVDCYWKNCPPAPEGCVSLDFEGVCERSLYLCPIPKKGEPLPFAVNSGQNSVPTMAAIAQVKPRGKSQEQKLTCDILGVEYKVGELVGVASDPCMECRCALDSLYCSPKCCFQPAETLQDASKASRSDDVNWYPVLSNPLKHLRTEFEG